MKVILEAQHAVGHPQPRGVGHYALTLIQSLLKRKAFNYELTFFDYKREVGNLERAKEYFDVYDVPLNECIELDYRKASRDDNVWNMKSYNEWTNTNADIYHFMNIISIPTQIEGKPIATVLDLNWKAYPEGTSDFVRQLATMGLERLQYIQPNVITISNSARNELLEYSNIPFDKIHVSYPSYDEINLYPESSKANDYGDYIFFVGTFERKKNVTGIIAAFNQIAEKFKGIKLVLAGKPTWDDPTEIYEAINASPFKERIITLGYITVEQKRNLYSNALCFVFPSICEGFGIPVLEAMACGCPVITANNTSLPEVGGDAAAYVNARDTEQLAFEIERVITSVDLRQEMISKGFLQSKKFSWDKTAMQVETIYQTVMSRE